MTIARKKTRGAKGESAKAKDPEGFVPKEGDMSRPKIIGELVWCPLCNEYAKFIKIANAARLASVNRRSIYRYIDEGVVYTAKVAGKSYRVCSSCLLKFADEQANPKK